MNNMKINRLKIVNYKLFQNVTIEMNENINIFVGENDSGKSTILEALSMVLTGKINGSSVANRLNLDWFNAQVRQKFKESIEAGNTPDLPTIEIEVYFASPDEDEIAIKKYRGTNNSLHEDAEGVKLEIIFDTQYAPAFNQEICDFINTIHGDADSMVEPDPNNQQEMPVENSGVYMMNVDSLREYCEYYHPIILRYDKKAKVGFQHDCDVFNYGGSKGATYERVVIIPVSTTLPFIERQVKITSNQTRAKFYVACTRAKHSVVFAMENPCENGVFKATDIHFSDKSIPAYKFSKPDSDI